jgi:hypothetical protein
MGIASVIVQMIAMIALWNFVGDFGLVSIPAILCIAFPIDKYMDARYRPLVKIRKRL